MPDDLAQQLSLWRHHLHAHPELSLKESGTAAFVCARLTEMEIPHTAGIGGHGVVGVLSRGGGNRAVGLRADMDALPIHEATGLAYASRHAGVMHACGHDGHTVSLLGAAALLLRDHSWSGKIYLVFQPAEEGFGGAEAMLADGLLERFPMQSIYGYHNWPGLEAGKVLLHEGPVMAGAANFSITLHGRAGHAAMPHDCADPVQGLAHLIIALNSITARNKDPQDAGVISTCTLSAGEARNQIPNTTTLGGTIRALTPHTMQLLKTRLAEVARHTARAHELEAEVEIFSNLPPTINSKAEVDLAFNAAQAAGVNVERAARGSMAAEDFGRFLEVLPGAYAWIGNGATAPLHNPGYDYNDAILPLAARYLAIVAKAALA